MLSRRTLMAYAVAAATVLPARAQTSSTAYAFSFEGLDGKTIRLSDHAGRVILVVNTASACGFTPQYADLQQLWTRYRDRGLTIIGVPSDDFNQERGTAAEIADCLPGRLRRLLSDGRQAPCHRRRGASLLSLGRGPEAERHSHVELPQVRGRADRAGCRSLSGPRQADRSPHHQPDRSSAGKRLKNVRNG